MADFGSPVATNVNVNPLQTLSSVLGIKQQQQNLQTGQANLATAQANASINTRVAQERQNLASIDWSSPQFKNEDGSPKEDAITSTALQAAPTTGAEFAGRLLLTAQTSAKTKSDFFALNQQYQQPIRDALAVWGANANSTPLDLHDQLDAIVQNAPKDAHDRLAQFRDDTLKALHIPNVFTGQDKGAEEQHQTAVAFSRTALSPEAASGPGGVATQQPATLNTGGSILTGSVAPAASATPGKFTPQSGVATTLSPAEQLPYVKAKAGTEGEVQADTSRFANLMSTAANSQSGIALADQVGALAQQVRTGNLSKEWADRLAVLQQSNPQITARQMLGKYAAQLQTLAESNAATDAERSQIKAGMPDPDHMDPGAVRQAAQYLHGYFRMSQARGQNALQHVQSTGGIPGVTVSDTSFASQRNPFVYAFKDMPRADQKQFLLERFGPGRSKELDQFEQQVKASQ